VNGNKNDNVMLLCIQILILIHAVQRLYIKCDQRQDTHVETSIGVWTHCVPLSPEAGNAFHDNVMILLAYY